jgi:hypothetical protein
MNGFDDSSRESRLEQRRHYAQAQEKRILSLNIKIRWQRSFVQIIRLRTQAQRMALRSQELLNTAEQIYRAEINSPDTQEWRSKVDRLKIEADNYINQAFTLEFAACDLEYQVERWWRLNKETQ